MENKDSIRLLKECDSGTKMGIESLCEIMDNVKNAKLHHLLSENKALHEKLSHDI